MVGSQNVEPTSNKDDKIMDSGQKVRIQNRQNRQSQFEDEIQPFLIQSYKENVELFFKQFPNKKQEAIIYAQCFQDNLYLEYFIDQQEKKALMSRISEHLQEGNQSLKAIVGDQFEWLKEKALENVKKEMEFIFQFHQDLIKGCQQLKEIKIKQIQEKEQSFNHNTRTIKRKKTMKFGRNYGTMSKDEAMADPEDSKQYKKNVDRNVAKIENKYQTNRRQQLIDSLSQQNNNDSLQCNSGFASSRPNYMRETARRDRDIELFNTRKTVQLDYQQQVLKLVSKDREYRNRVNSTSLGFAQNKNHQQISKLKKYQQLTPIHVNFDNEKDECYSTTMKRFKLSAINKNNISVQDNRKFNESGIKDSLFTSRNRSVYNEQEEPNKNHRKLNKIIKQSDTDTLQQSYLTFKPSNKAPQSLGKQILSKLNY